MEPIQIKTKEDFDYLINQIQQKSSFAEAFYFEDDSFKEMLLSFLGISTEGFNEKYYYYNSDRKLHVSESERGYIWISTIGLVATKEFIPISDKYVRSCTYQYHTLSILFEKIIHLIEREDVYDVDAHTYYYLSEIMPSFFHNLLFYFEIFGKAYLSLTGEKPKIGHELSSIYDSVNKMMFKKKHNNTIFHAYVIHEFENIVDYVNSIPGGFKEHFVKYDDNPGDQTYMKLERAELENIKSTIDYSFDFISDYYYSEKKSINQGLFERLLSKAKDENGQKMIHKTYGFLIDESKGKD